MAELQKLAEKEAKSAKPMEETMMEAMASGMLKRKRADDSGEEERKAAVADILENVVSQLELNVRAEEDAKRRRMEAKIIELTETIMSSQTSHTAEILGLSDEEMKLIILEEAQKSNFWLDLLNEAAEAESQDEVSEAEDEEESQDEVSEAEDDDSQAEASETEAENRESEGAAEADATRNSAI